MGIIDSISNGPEEAMDAARQLKNRVTDTGFDEMQTYADKQEHIDQKNREQIKSWSQLKGFKEFVHAFAGQQAAPIMRGDINAYLMQRVRSGQPFSDAEREIGAMLGDLNVPNAVPTTPGLTKIQQDAERNDKLLARREQLTLLLGYLNQRNAVVQETAADINAIKPVSPELPLGLDKVWGGTKGALSSSLEAFGKADGKGKVVMLAGVVASVMLLRAVWKLATRDSSGKERSFSKILKVGLGGYLSYAAISMISKSVEKSSGRSLPGHFNRVAFGETQPEYDRKRQLEDVEVAWQKLKGEEMPVENFTDFLSNGKESERFALAISNLTSLDLAGLRLLYEEGRATQGIGINSPAYPKLPFATDGLNDIERFGLVREVVEDFGLIDQRGDWRTDLPYRPDQSFVYLALELGT